MLIANLVAWPLAFVAMRTWLAGFGDRIALSPLYFVGASLLAIVIAVLTVLGQSLRASRAAPAWAPAWCGCMAPKRRWPSPAT